MVSPLPGAQNECVWAQERIHELLIGTLDVRARARLGRHMLACCSCRNYLRDMRRLPGLLASFGAPSVPPGLADYIKGVCFFSAGMDRAPRIGRRLVYMRVSYAGAVAAAVLLLVVLSARMVTATTERPRRQRVAAGAQLTAHSLHLVRQSGRSFSSAPALEPRPLVWRQRHVAPVRRLTESHERSSVVAAVNNKTTAVGRAVLAPAPVSDVVRAAASRASAIAEPGWAARGSVELPSPRAGMPEAVLSDTHYAVPNAGDTVAAGAIVTGMIATALVDRYVADIVAEHGAYWAAHQFSSQPTEVRAPSPLADNGDVAGL